LHGSFVSNIQTLRNVFEVLSEVKLSFDERFTNKIGKILRIFYQ
jgi:hypothetical protein